MIFNVFPTVTADPITYDGTWAQIVDFIRTAPTIPNDDYAAPLIKLATLGPDRNAKGSLCHTDNITSVTGIEGDYDAGQMPPEQAGAMMQMLGLQCLIFTTKRHGIAGQRWRILCPLSGAYAPADRRVWAERLNALLGGILAKESGVLAQRYYYGPRAGLAAPLVWSIDGQPLDVVAAQVQGLPWVTHESPAREDISAPGWDEKTPEQQAECLADLRDALTHLDPDDRDSWVARGQELACLGDVGREMWEAWSLTSKRDYPDGHGFEKWNSFTGARSDYRSLFAEASRKGWANPARTREALKRFGLAPTEVVEPTVTEVHQLPGVKIVDGSTLMFPDVQPEFFKDCVYIRDVNRIRMPDGDMLDKSRFDVDKGGFSFVMDAASQMTPTKSAWDVFTQSQALRFPKATSTCFMPELTSGALIVEEGRVYVNSYVPIETKRVDGCPDKFLDLISRILPVERDRRILLSYLASMLQNPGAKFQWWPVIQGCEGNGKTIIIRAMEFAVGKRYSHLPNVDDLAKNGGKFNGWIDGRLFLGLEEVYVPNRRDFLEAFKTTVTNDRLPVENKGVDQRMTDNRANGIMATNHKDGVPITIDTRRYCVFYTAQQSAEHLTRDGMNGKYFPDLYRWLKGIKEYAHLGKNHGFAVINNWLREYQVDPEFDPAGDCQRAPRTSAFVEAVATSLGQVEQTVTEAIEECRRGFCGGFISSNFLDELLNERRINLTQNRRVEILRTLGYEKHPALAGGRTNNPVTPDGKKIKIYVDVKSDSYNLTHTVDVEKNYSKAQELIFNAPFRTL